jgi:Bacterial Ig domain
VRYGGEGPARRAILRRRFDPHGSVRPAEIAIPGGAVGWVLVGRGPHGEDWRSLVTAIAALHRAGLATLTIDLPRRTPAAAARLRSVADDVRVDLAGGLPVTYLGAGTRAAAGWMASQGGGLDGVIALNGSAGACWQALRHVTAPSLLLVDHDRVDLPWQLLLGKAISWKLGGGAELELLDSRSPIDPELVARWYWDRVICPAPTLLPARSRYGASGRQMARLGAVVALAVPALGAPAIEPGTAAAAVPNFANGTTLPAGEIAGDNARFMQVEKASERKAGKRLRAGEILGDGAVPDAVGSRRLVDGDGVQYFVNTNITFSTSSSASGGMSEASYTHSVSATTLNGGEVQSRLNDAYDGYETICVANDNTVNAPCETGNANYEIYNKNGSSALESNGRQADFNAQTIEGVTVTRKVFVPSDDSFARWLDIVHNPGTTAKTVTVETGNNLGSDNNTVITNDSSGNTSPTTADTWVTTFQNFSGGTTTSDPRLGHVLGSKGATVGLAGLFFQNGNDNPYWGYTFTVPAGATRIIMNYGVVQPSRAAAAAKSAQLADLTDAHQLDFMSASDEAEVLNFAVPTSAVADSYSLDANTTLDQPAPGVLSNDPATSDLTAVLVSGPSRDASFQLNSDGSFSYTPIPGFAGTDSFTYESKGLGGGTSSPTTVTLNVIGNAPSITSADTAAFTVGTAGSFTIRTTGLPTPAIADATPLPAGLGFTDNHDGTATISGTPAAGTQGSYPIAVSAANGQGSNASQTITLQIAAAPKQVGNLAQILADIERDTGQILHAYGVIAHDTTRILAHIAKPASTTHIHHLLTQAASLAKQSRALNTKAKHEGATQTALGDANLARKKAARARQLIAEARHLAAVARRHP